MNTTKQAMTITFRAKVQSSYWADGSLAYQYIKVPKFTTRHCNMPAFRSSRKYGMFANSDLFPNMLANIRRHVTGETIKLGFLMDPRVSIDTSGFLAEVTVTLEDMER